jgi:hypothetical protein
MNDTTMMKETPSVKQDNGARAEQGGDNADLECGPGAPGNIELVGDRFIVDWDGPDDVGNPLNWPPGKRWAHIILIAILGLITYVLS